MAVIETWLRQDLKGLVTVRSLQGQVFSLDNGGNLIGVKVTKDSKPVTLTGTVTGYCILSDGQTVTVTGSGKSGIQNGNEAYIVLPQLVYSVPGQISIVIKLTSGSVTTTLAACTGYVYRSRTSNEVVPSGTPIPDLATLEEAISRANTAADSANTAATSANNAATAAERVNVAMSKTGKVITITATNRSGASTNHTVTEPTLTVERANNVVTVTATDADGQTSIEFDAVDADEVAELKEAVSTKAEEDGYYEELAAGTADQLVSTEAVTDTTPYLYRKSGGSVDIGNRETLEKIVGGTVAWNQLSTPITESKTDRGLTITPNDDGSVTINGTSNASGVVGSFQKIAVINAHKYLIAPAGLVQGLSMYTSIGGSLSSSVPIIRTHQSDFNGDATLRTDANITYSNVKVWLNTFDLTAMFGPTIADYIYNLEQTTAGAGVAWFRKLFPKDYYPYNPGELISVKTTSHDMVGFNLWDEEWEVGAIDRTTGANRNANYAIRSINYISVLPNAQYAIRFSDKYRTGSFSSCLVAFYDHEKKFISAAASINAFTGKTLETFTTTGDTKYIRFHVGDYADQKPGNYYEDICINLSDPSRNGEYEPYEKHSYPLADVELRGVVSIDSDGKLVYDGDEYTPDGNVKRKYSLVDLGTLNWVLDTTTRPADGVTIHAAYAALPTAKKTDPANEVGNMFLAGYETTTVAFVDRAGLTVVKDKLVGGADMNGRIWLYDSAYNDLTREQVKTALSGSILLYELAAPETEQVDPYNAVQVVDDWGTEEFVDTREVAIPVGHSTSYMDNLRDKLQHLPSLAEEDGEYIVKQTGTKMELSKLSSSGLAQSIYESIESAPVASFADGADGQAMKAVNVAIEPVQDLHGYDAPWPTGGGANLVLLTVDAIKAANGGTDTWNGNSKTISGVTYTILTDEAGNVTGINANGTATASSKLNLGTIHAVSGTTYGIKKFSADDGGSLFGNINPRFSSATDVNIYDNTTMTADSDKNVAVSYYTMTGGVANNRLITPFIAVTSTAPTAFAPYSNICPITGWTGAKVTRTGKNLLVKTFSHISAVPNSLDECFFLKAGMYTLSVDSFTSATSWRFGIRLKDATGNDLNAEKYRPRQWMSWNTLNSMWLDGVNGNYTTIPITLVEDCYIRIVFGLGDTSASTVANGAMLSVGSTALPYEPYQGQTYEVTFPTEAGTVYGGTLDVVRGKLVVDRVSYTESGSSTINASQANRFYIIKADAMRINPLNQLTEKSVSCDRMASATWGGLANANWACAPCWGKGIAFAADSITTANDWKTYFTENPTQFSYKLEQGIELTLTPTEIRTLLGINNVWSDAGNTSVTYPADTKTYIDNRINSTKKLIAGIETGFAASKLYAVGDMLIIGDDLYKVTAQIASGATITVGTNVTKTTVAEQLLALMNA